MATTHPIVVKTRSKAPYALVKVYRLRTPAEAEIVGYAYSKSERVLARARKLRAHILPIVGGKVEVEG